MEEMSYETFINKLRYEIWIYHEYYEERLAARLGACEVLWHQRTISHLILDDWLMWEVLSEYVVYWAST